MAWSYSDWITYARGSATRLSRLRLHIQEVSDVVHSGSYQINGRSVSRAEAQSYLDTLLSLEAVEDAALALADSSPTATRIGWSRGRAIL